MKQRIMNLNPSQIEAINNPHPRILVSAAPGAGKTRVYIERIKRMVADGINPRTIIAVTFTNNAAAEIQRRLGETVKLGYVGTLHGFLLRLLQEHGAIIGLASKLTVLDEVEAEACRKDAETKLSYKGTAKAVDAQISLGVGCFRGSCYKPKSDAERVSFEYYFGLLTTGCITFDMILDLGLELVQHLARPEIGQYRHIRNFEHLLVDEYQDANGVDAQIYDALPVKTRFFVGDARQSIFGFRGGDINVMLSEAARPETKCLSLVENYRSALSICSAANRLMSHGNIGMADIICANPDIEGDFVFVAHDIAATEQSVIANEIKTLIAGSTAPDEIAVLLRTNALCADFRQTFESFGVPIKKKKAIENPLGWKQAKAFIGMLTNPESDRLAYKFVELKNGTEAAQKLQRAAVDNFSTINQDFLHIRNMQIEDVTTAMVQANLERESIGRIRQLIETLQPGASLLELQSAMMVQEAESCMEGPGVTVSTCHAAKGMEYEVVYIPAMEEGIFPSRGDVEEERRLFYVAITRAKRIAVVSWCKQRVVKWSGLQQRERSRFINDVR